MNTNLNFSSFNLILLKNQNDIFYSIFAAFAGLLRTLFSAFLCYSNEIVFLILLSLFFLISANYVTNNIIAYNNSVSRSTYQDFPEMNPKDDWFKFIKDIVIENKIAIFVCTVSIGTAFYFYSKYQTTNYLFETLKNTHLIEKLNETKLNEKFVLINEAYQNLEKKNLILLHNINESTAKVSSINSITQRYKNKLLYGSYNNVHLPNFMNQNLIFFPGIEKKRPNYIEVLHEIELNFFRKSVIIDKNYNSKRLQLTNIFFDTYKSILYSDEKNVQKIKEIDILEKKLKQFIFSNPYLTNFSTKEYIHFENLLNEFLLLTDIDKVYVNEFNAAFFDLFFGYDPVKKIFILQGRSKFRHFHYYTYLEHMRKNIILDNKFDFTIIFEYLDYCYSNKDLQSPLYHSKDILRCKRQFLKEYFLPLIIEDLFSSNKSIYNQQEWLKILQLNSLVKHMPENQFFEKNAMRYFFKDFFILVSKIETLDSKLYNEQELESWINDLCLNDLELLSLKNVKNK